MKKELIILGIFLALLVVISSPFNISVEKEQVFGATILTTDETDTIGTFRTNVNTSLTNLNDALGGATFPFTATSYGVSTSTTVGFTAGFLSSASSSVSDLLVTRSTTTNATTTSLFSTTASSTNLFSTSINTGTLNTAGLATLLGGTIINSASSTATNLFTINATSTYATTTDLSISNRLDVDTLTSALTLTGATGIFAEYTGTTCTNQVVTALSALGVATCSSINNDYYSGTDLSVANGGTGLSTFGGNNTVLYTTSADTLASEAAFTYVASTNLLTFDFASTTAITTSGELVVPLNKTLATQGEITIDTTAGQFVFHDGNNSSLVTGTSTRAFNLASTTLDAGGKKFNTATSTFLIMNDSEPLTLVGFYCKATSTASTATIAHVRFGDGTNWTTEASCSTTGAFTNTASNNTFTAEEDIQVQASSTAGAISRITITAKFNKTRQ